MSESRRAGGKASAKKPWAGEKFPVKPAGIYRGTHFRTGEVGYFYSTHEHGWRGPFPTAREANAHRHDYQAAKARPATTTEDMPFRQFLTERYLPAKASSSPATRKHRRSTIGRIERVRPQFMDLMLSEVNKVELEMLRSALDATPRSYKPSVVKVTLDLVSAVMRYAVDDGRLTHWQVKVDRPKLAKVRAPSPMQVRLMLERTGHDRSTLFYRPIIATIVATGLRNSEARGLTLDNLPALRRDLRTGRWEHDPAAEQRLYVTGQLSDESPPRLIPPKSDAGHRWLPLDPTTYAYIVAHLNEHGHGPTMAGVHDDDPMATLVFGGRGTKQSVPWVSDNALTTAVSQAARRAGFRTTVHGLRHFYATQCAAAGVGVKELQRRMGHANFSITYQLYADFMPQSEEDPAAAAIAAVLAGTAPAEHQHQRRTSTLPGTLGHQRAVSGTEGNNV